MVQASGLVQFLEAVLQRSPSNPMSFLPTAEQTAPSRLKSRSRGRTWVCVRTETRRNLRCMMKDIPCTRTESPTLHRNRQTLLRMYTSSLRSLRQRMQRSMEQARSSTRWLRASRRRSRACRQRSKKMCRPKSWSWCCQIRKSNIRVPDLPSHDTVRKSESRLQQETVAVEAAVQETAAVAVARPGPGRMLAAALGLGAGQGLAVEQELPSNLKCCRSKVGQPAAPLSKSIRGSKEV